MCWVNLSATNSCHHQQSSFDSKVEELNWLDESLIINYGRGDELWMVEVSGDNVLSEDSHRV